MKFSFIVLFIASVLLSGCGGAGKAASDEKGSAPKTADKKDTNEVMLPVSEQKDLIVVETLETRSRPDVIHGAGRIALADDATWRVGVLTTGRVEKVYVHLGDYVKEGQVLAGMRSHDVHEARAAYQTAQADLSHAQSLAVTAQRNYERAQRLYSMKAGSLADVERTKQDVTNAEAEIRNQQITVEKERIHIQDNLGIDPNADPANEEAELIPIKAPGSGYIIDKKVTPGSVINPNDDAFVIGNLGHLWMLASIEESDVSRISTKLTAKVTARSFPNDSFTGTITNLEAKIDPATRTMRVRIELQNSGNKLRPEMLADAQIQTLSSQSVLTIPTEGLQQINDQDVVFVKTADDRFEVRPVRMGDVYDGRVTILEGLKAGEVVVVKGTFLLKSLLLKASLSEG